jgi:hypothetical protein
MLLLMQTLRRQYIKSGLAAPHADATPLAHEGPPCCGSSQTPHRSPDPAIHATEWGTPPQPAAAVAQPDSRRHSRRIVLMHYAGPARRAWRVGLPPYRREAALTTALTTAPYRREAALTTALTTAPYRRGSALTTALTTAPYRRGSALTTALTTAPYRREAALTTVTTALITLQW